MPRAEVPSRAVRVELSMDIADWYAVPFRLLLASAERLREAAIRRGSGKRKTSSSRSSALLRLVTSPDQYRRPVERLRVVAFGIRHP